MNDYIYNVTSYDISVSGVVGTDSLNPSYPVALSWRGYCDPFVYRSLCGIFQLCVGPGPSTTPGMSRYTCYNPCVYFCKFVISRHCIHQSQCFPSRILSGTFSRQHLQKLQSMQALILRPSPSSSEINVKDWTLNLWWLGYIFLICNYNSIQKMLRNPAIVWISSQFILGIGDRVYSYRWKKPFNIRFVCGAPNTSNIR